MADHPSDKPDMDAPDPTFDPTVEPTFEPTRDVPVEDDGIDEAAPRRAASAEFVVDTRVGSDALLREAMDPANQSLAEALRLSFRVLQVVILVLVVLFVFSGFQTVAEGQSGVLLRWGKILKVDGREALEPGLKFSRWPYPAGEFVLFDQKNRKVDLRERFWPAMRGVDSIETAINQASVNQQLRPGRDGSILTDGGDIAHIRLAADYEIDAPARFVHAVEDINNDPGRLDADKLVELALERAAVHLGAQRSLQDFVDLADGGKLELQRLAQDVLDGVDAGIRVVGVETPIDPTPALAIKKAYGDLQEARVMADEMAENARQDAHNTLLSVAGHRYPLLIDLIEQYEDAYELGEETRTEALLASINEHLESPDTSGEVARILSFANSYRSIVDLTLGQEFLRFQSLLPRFRDNPAQLAQQLWYETYGRVLDANRHADVEIFFVPDDSVVSLQLGGLDHIRQTRRENKLATEGRDSYLGVSDPNRYIRRASEYRGDGPVGGRQLDAQGNSLRRR